MFAIDLHQFQLYIQHGVSLAGIFIILSGIIFALCQYGYYLVTNRIFEQATWINNIRLNLSRVLILGLEFIVAADLIGTTTTPDYYTVGIVASIVAIRTVLSYTINREIADISKE